MNDRKCHRIAALRWIGYGAMLLGLLGGLGGTGMGAGALAPAMRVGHQLAEARASAGEAALDEGRRLYEQQTTESLRQAIVKLKEAQQMFHVQKKTSEEAITLLFIGRIYDDLGEKQTALEYFNKALLMWRAVKNSAGQASALNNIGSIYDSLGDKKKALEYYEKALPLSHLGGNRTVEAEILGNIAAAYDDLGNKDKALENYNPCT
jgi:tetratricopeptide (TPR) repeat protein